MEEKMNLTKEMQKEMQSWRKGSMRLQSQEKQEFHQSKVLNDVKGALKSNIEGKNIFIRTM